MLNAFRDVVAFEKACGHMLSKGRPKAPKVAIGDLRYRLIEEESRETLDALLSIQERLDGGESIPDACLAELADGLADLIFVCIGTAIHFGIDLSAVWDSVCESNMKKFGEGSWVDQTGKRRKPPGWQPPDVVAVLANQKPLAQTYAPDLAENHATDGGEA